MSNNGILLESGTNEVEILEFVLGGQSFGVNVLKIQAIEQFDPDKVTQIHLSHDSVVGTLLFRDSCITLVDLSKEMDFAPAAGDLVAEAPEDEAVDSVLGSTAPQITDTNGIAIDHPDTKLVLVMEFNNLKTAFLVDGVNRIHRVSWESINPLSAFLGSTDSKFTGSMAIDQREILIVDMEKVVNDILPGEQAAFQVKEEFGPVAQARAEVCIFLAEDSSVIRDKVLHELASAGYTDVTAFPNGRDCHDRIVDLQAQAAAEGGSLADHLGALITDIEMPQMDGLALCRSVKTTLGAPQLPVVIFSSLINEQIANKCEAVKANAYITKPQFLELVGILDNFCLEPAAVGG